MLRGGHNYPWLVRNTPRKPLKVFLQDGAQDINNQHGSWPLANQELAAALECKMVMLLHLFAVRLANPKSITIADDVLPPTRSVLWTWDFIQNITDLWDYGMGNTSGTYPAFVRRSSPALCSASA